MTTREIMELFVGRIVYGGLMISLLYLIFRLGKKDWGYAIIFGLTVVFCFFACFSFGFRNPKLRVGVEVLASLATLVTVISLVVRSVLEIPNNEGWIKPKLQTLVPAFFCAFAVLFGLYLIFPESLFDPPKDKNLERDAKTAATESTAARKDLTGLKQSVDSSKLGDKARTKLIQETYRDLVPAFVRLNDKVDRANLKLNYVILQLQKADRAQRVELDRLRQEIKTGRSAAKSDTSSAK